MTSPSLEIRPYQIEAIEELRISVARHGSVVFVLPTGGGKTIVAAMIARMAFSKGNSTLFIVHRRELVGQAVSTLENAVPGSSIGVEARGWPSQPWAPLQIGMVQTLVRRAHVKRPDLIIVDEAHHSRANSWEKVLSRWPDVPRIGLTATPERLDGKGLGQHFNHMVLGPSILDLVDEGYLAPTITRRIPSGLALEGVRKNQRGDYVQSELQERVTKKVVVDAADAYCNYAMGKRAIFFGIHTEHSKHVCAILRERGVRAAHVDGTDSPSRRDRLMTEFRTGGLDIVGNCDLISEGFDAPACEVVIMGAPTRSITRYLQQAGRAMRPGEGKVAEVLDLAGTSHELGLPDDPRVWSLEGGEVQERKAGEKNAKKCPECLALFRSKRCPSCGMESALPIKAPEEVSVTLEIATPERKNREPRLRRNQLNRLLREARLSQDPLNSLYDISEQNGYKPGWVMYIANAWGIPKKDVLRHERSAAWQR